VGVSSAAELSNLIVVCGHAIYVAEDFEHPEADESWCLAPFQKGEPRFYIEHIRTGVELAAADPRALLVFSGGMTRKEAGRKSEAAGYLRVAEHFGFFGHADVARRATIEEYARDSFENLRFSIARFRERAAKEPEQVSAVSWRFKSERFDLHREALGWPRDRFRFVGPNDPPDLERAMRGERAAIELYASGADGEAALARKRRERDPFARPIPYDASS